MSSIGLCMIVKDESHVIERCLSSVRHLIDHWTILDTGSTDGTQRLIAELLAGIPGALHERPWRDFGHNRSEALELARPHADYSFVIDADEVLEVPPGFAWPALHADAIELTHRTQATSYLRRSLVANRLPWVYRGVLHEYLEAPGEDAAVHLPGPVVLGMFDGGRSQGVSTVEKYARDARTLAAALESEPDNSRYQYYLARSYRDSEQYELALAAYRRRATMGGFAEEVSDSLLEVAQHLERLGAEPAQIVDAYLAAWESRPTRAEALTQLARYCREHDRFAVARIFAARAIQIERPQRDLLWVDEEVYAWRSRDEYAVASYWTGDYADSAAACHVLLREGRLPAAQQGRVEANLRYAEDKLGVARPAAPAVPQQRTGAGGGVQGGVGGGVPMVEAAAFLRDLLGVARPIQVVDVGANPIDGPAPYLQMLRAGMCEVIGFEPQPDALARLRAAAGPRERYLPHVIGSGEPTDLFLTEASGMVSALPPDPARLALFNGFAQWGAVTGRERVETTRLDDIVEIAHLDFLRMDVQGGELTVLRGAPRLLAEAVMVALEVSFVPLYRGQPSFGELDVELRALGFLPHAMPALKRWSIAPVVHGGDLRNPGNQLLEADVTYCRDLGRFEELSPGQLAHLALLAHHVHGSIDLVHHVLLHLAQRGVHSVGDAGQYLRIAQQPG